MTTPIENRIREHYCAENGEWLVEKGKVNEAKLLKEACEELERLRAENHRLLRHEVTTTMRLRDREEALKTREAAMEVREADAIGRLDSLITLINKWKAQR